MAKTKTTTKRQTKTKTKKQATPDDEVKVCRRRSDRRTKAETNKEAATETAKPKAKPKAKATKTTTSKSTGTKTTTGKAAGTKTASAKVKTKKTTSAKASPGKAAAAAAKVIEAENPAPPKPEKRKVQRRRQIDPTTCERDYTDDEIEFMHALDEYKRANGRMFPTCSEILEVVRKLGYQKSELDPNQVEVVAAPIVSSEADPLNLMGPVEAEIL